MAVKTETVCRHEVDNTEIDATGPVPVEKRDNKPLDEGEVPPETDLKTSPLEEAKKKRTKKHHAKQKHRNARKCQNGRRIVTESSEYEPLTDPRSPHATASLIYRASNAEDHSPKGNDGEAAPADVAMKQEQDPDRDQSTVAKLMPNFVKAEAQSPRDVKHEKDLDRDSAMQESNQSQHSQEEEEEEGKNSDASQSHEISSPTEPTENVKRRNGIRRFKSQDKTQSYPPKPSIIDFTLAHEQEAKPMLGFKEKQLGRGQTSISSSSSKPASDPKSMKRSISQKLELALTQCIQSGNVFGQELQRHLSDFILTNMPETSQAEKKRKRGRPRKNSALPVQRFVTCSIQVAMQQGCAGSSSLSSVQKLENRGEHDSIIAEGKTRSMKKQLKQLTIAGAPEEAAKGLNLTFDIAVDSLAKAASDSGPNSSRKANISDEAGPLKTANIHVSSLKPPE